MRQLLQVPLLCVLSAITTFAQDPSEPLRVPSADTAALRQTLDRIKQLRLSGELGPRTVELPAGVYRFEAPLQLTAETVGQGLTMKASEPGSVVWSAARPLGPGERDEHGRWHFPLPRGWDRYGTPRLLSLDGQLRPAARFPNEGYIRIERALDDRRSGFVMQPEDLPPEMDLGAGVCDLILLHDWSSSRIPVEQIDRESRILRTVGPVGCAADHYAIDHFEPQPRYWLEGHSAFADTPGEWYVDPTRGEVVVLGGPDDTAPDAALPWVKTILIAGDLASEPVQNLTISGVTFSDTRFPMPPGGLAAAQATMHEPRDAEGKRTTQDRPMLAAAVHMENAVQCQIRSCQFTQLGGTGLWLGSRVNDSSVTSCLFDRIGGNGLNMGENNSRLVQGQPWFQAAPDQVPTGNRIDQCEFRMCGIVLPGSVAIWAPLNRRLSITNNHIHDCPYTGISLGWLWNDSASPARENRIARNRIEFVMQVLSDGGGIYTLGRQPESIIEENEISDVPLNTGRAESNGMFLDEGTTDFTIRRNTIRRIDRSPLRFHRAGPNTVRDNRWELATPETPPVRFNNTPEENITIESNAVLEPQQRVFLIGNSLTWDTVPSRLDGDVDWHVDCGKSLQYIHDHPDNPCVDSSRIWTLALATAQYDVLAIQPHYGTTLEQDVAVISHWLELQPHAEVVIHTGWPRHAALDEERADSDPAGPLTHSTAYFDALLATLRQQHPGREFRTTGATQLLQRLADDIQGGRAPFASIEQLYRDAIHMTTGAGRYLMHNAMRQALGQPLSDDGFSDIEPDVKSYCERLLASSAE